MCDTKCCLGPEKCTSNGEFSINNTQYHKVCRTHWDYLPNYRIISCAYCNSIVFNIFNFSSNQNIADEIQAETLSTNKSNNSNYCYKCTSYVDQLFKSSSNEMVCSKCYYIPNDCIKSCGICKDQDKKLYETECGKELCETCWFYCCKKFCIQCRVHFPNELEITYCKKQLCNKCKSKCCESLCVTCKNHEMNKLLHTECNKLVCQICFRDCCENKCAQCQKHSNSEIKLTECKKKLCFECQKNCCNELCEGCKKHSNSKISLTECQKKFCLKCRAYCCDRLCNGCNNHSHLQLKHSGCGKNLCEACFPKCCLQKCYKCENHQKLLIKSQCHQMLCDDCINTCCINKCQRCNNHSSSQITATECGQQLCNQCQQICCNKKCMQCKSHNSSAIIATEHGQCLCDQCKQKVAERNCFKCGLPSKESLQLYGDNKRYCLQCEPKKCPNCSSSNQIKVDSNCPHVTCINCFDQCRECNKTRKICIHCDKSLQITHLFPCNHWDSCKSCTPFLEKCLKCINCANDPQHVKFSCGHLACKNCVKSYCKVCSVPNSKRCSICKMVSKPYKRLNLKTNKKIVCNHYQCFGCASKSEECEFCHENEIRNITRPIFHKKKCELCNKIKDCSDLNQNCSHVLCDDCASRCRLCIKICVACENKTDFRYTCEKSHTLCRSCSGNKASCIICLEDDNKLQNCSQSTFTFQSIENNKRACN